MAAPLRNEVPNDQAITAELTTADLAHSNPPLATPAIEDDPRVKPFLAEPVELDPDEGASAGHFAEERFRREKSTPSTSVSIAHDDSTLIPSHELEGLRDRWSDVQTGFVDEPRKAVEQADSLVASAMKRLTEVFAEERSNLEKQWDRGDSVSTEDLRVALQRYRAFFQRLLAI